MLNVPFFSFLPCNRESNGMRDYRFSSITVPTFSPCFSRYLLAVVHSGSDIEMSKPLSQITRAEDAFSGRLTMRRSPLCRQSFGSGCQKSLRSQGCSFNILWKPYGHFISGALYQILRYLYANLNWREELETLFISCQDVTKENDHVRPLRRLGLMYADHFWWFFF